MPIEFSSTEENWNDDDEQPMSQFLEPIIEITEGIDTINYHDQTTINHPWAQFKNTSMTKEAEITQELWQIFEPKNTSSSKRVLVKKILKKSIYSKRNFFFLIFNLFYLLEPSSTMGPPMG